ncbi:M16 family metallopeptidase [Kitasatospora mediocidica]|uniref:M16 family metallopeptidase n=1 Tax=Kitasatospora mediocidica TaxID=58352 RepID=UPI00055B8C2F|nr:pitrilysin family protein [Kitasatospora mediocidica]
MTAAPTAGATLVRQSPGRGRSASAMVYLSAGSWSDPVGASGLAHLYEHAFFAGAGPHPTAGRIAAAVSALGCTMDARTAAEYSYFRLSGPDETLREAVDLLLTCYTRPGWDPAELAAQRTAIRNELRLFADNRSRRLRQLVTRALHGDGRFGLPALGVAEQLDGLDRESIAGFAADSAGPGRLTLLVDSPREDPGIERTVQRHLPLSAAPVPPPPGPHPRAYGPRGHTVLAVPGRTVLAALAVPGPSYRLGNRDIYALRLFHSIVGGMPGSRLGELLRNRLGLSYQARTVLELHAATGALLVLFSCLPEDLAKAFDAVHDLLGRALAEPPSAEELARAVAVNRGIHVRDRETAEGRCLVTGNEVLRRGAPQPEEELFALWGDISASDVVTVARRELRPELARAVVVGPQDCHLPLLDRDELPGPWHVER